MGQALDVEATVKQQDSEAHFWVAAYPIFESTLIIAPDPTVEGGAISCKLKLYDADGNCFNDCALTCPRNQVTAFDLKPFLESCKLESGWKHAHLAVTSSPGVRFVCRIADKEKSSFVSTSPFVLESGAHSFPITLSSRQQNLLSFVSDEDEPVAVRCRLFCGKRKPEVTVVIPPHASKLLSIEEAFPEFCSTEGEDRVQGYLRLSGQKRSKVWVSMLEQSRTNDGKEVFTVMYS